MQLSSMILLVLCAFVSCAPQKKFDSVEPVRIKKDTSQTAGAYGGYSQYPYNNQYGYNQNSYPGYGINQGYAQQGYNQYPNQGYSSSVFPYQGYYGSQGSSQYPYQGYSNSQGYQSTYRPYYSGYSSYSSPYGSQTGKYFPYPGYSSTSYPYNG